MDDDVFAPRTPIRHYADHIGHRDSSSSALSFQSANSFPTYGFIKVSNSDQGSSCDSSSLVSPQGSAYFTNNEQRTTPGKKGHNQSYSQREGNYDGGYHTRTPLGGSDAMFGENLDLQNTENGESVQLYNLELPFNEEAKGLKIPDDTFERIRYFLGRITDAYHSEQGIFLNDRFFVNKQIFLECQGVPNGSVKVGIIQEMTSLLKKFVYGDESGTNVAAIEATLHYYEKLMDAFDVFAPPTYDDIGDNHSVSASAMLAATVDMEKTESKDTMNISLDSSCHNSTQTLDKRQRNSFILLDKFKGKMGKRRSMFEHATSPRAATRQQSREQLDCNTSPVKSHARSVSVSTTNSTRSQRDLCSLPEYMTLLESLCSCIDSAHDKYGTTSRNHEALTKVLDFIDTRVIVFIMRDVTQLALLLMKKTVNDYC